MIELILVEFELYFIRTFPLDQLSLEGSWSIYVTKFLPHLEEQALGEALYGLVYMKWVQALLFE